MRIKSSAQATDGGLRYTSANNLDAILNFLPHHSSTALATSARTQHLVRLERIRRKLLARSMPCVVVAWLLAHWAKAAKYLKFGALARMTLDPRALFLSVPSPCEREAARPREANVP